MAKLKLDLEALGVESFETTDAGGALAGTVRAHDFDAVTNRDPCLPQSTLAPSCGGQFTCKCTGQLFCGG